MIDCYDGFSLISENGIHAAPGITVVSSGIGNGKSIFYGFPECCRIDFQREDGKAGFLRQIADVAAADNGADALFPEFFENVSVGVVIIPEEKVHERPAGHFPYVPDAGILFPIVSESDASRTEGQRLAKRPDDVDIVVLNGQKGNSVPEDAFHEHRRAGHGQKNFHRRRKSFRHKTEHLLYRLAEKDIDPVKTLFRYDFFGFLHKRRMCGENENVLHQLSRMNLYFLSHLSHNCFKHMQHFVLQRNIKNTLRPWLFNYFLLKSTYYEFWHES